MNTTTRPITKAKYDEIKNKIASLRKQSKSQLVNEYRQQSRLDLGSLKDLTKDDLVFAVLNGIYTSRTLTAYDNKLISTIQTKDLKVGTVILVKSGNSFSDNIKTTAQVVSGVTQNGKRREVSFESGMVAFFGEHRDHKLAQ